MKAFVALALCVGGCAASDTGSQPSATTIARQDDLQERLAGYVAGPPQTCISAIDLRRASTEKFPYTLLYRTGPGRYFRVDLAEGCGPINRNDAVIDFSPTAQLCQGEVLQFADLVSGFQSSACTIASIREYRER